MTILGLLSLSAFSGTSILKLKCNSGTQFNEADNTSLYLEQVSNKGRISNSKQTTISIPGLKTFDYVDSSRRDLGPNEIYEFLTENDLGETAVFRISISSKSEFNNLYFAQIEINSNSSLYNKDAVNLQCEQVIGNIANN